MILWIWLIGTPVGFVVGCRAGFHLLLDGDSPAEADKTDLTMAMVLGVMVGALIALLWPLALAVGLARRFLFFSAQDRQAYDLGRKERELEEREERIRELERQAGIPSSHSYTKPGRFRS